MKSGPGGLIQGGITDGARKLFPAIRHEPTSLTGLKNVAGAIAMANGGPGTTHSDFFIMTSDFPSLDATATATDPGFAAFGHVVEGMDVARAILAAPVSPTKGVRREERADARADGEDHQGRTGQVSRVRERLTSQRSRTQACF